MKIKRIMKAVFSLKEQHEKEQHIAGDESKPVPKKAQPERTSQELKNEAIKQFVRSEKYPGEGRMKMLQRIIWRHTRQIWHGWRSDIGENENGSDLQL